MTIFQAIILGVVQGIGEFLPISSSGHLVLFENIMGVEEPDMFFDILLHMGTLIPILVVFWEDIWKYIKNPFQKYVYLLIVASIPAGVIGILFENYFEMLFAGTIFLGFGFIITGCLLLYADKPRDHSKGEKEMSYLDAVIIGFLQAFAMVPAVSRSGSTITGALSRGIDRETAAKFSFLMSIPVIGGAFLISVLQIIIGAETFDTTYTIPYLFGFFASMLSGYLAIKFMLMVIKKAKLKYFSYYVFVLGILVILDNIVFHLFF